MVFCGDVVLSRQFAKSDENARDNPTLVALRQPGSYEAAGEADNLNKNLDHDGMTIDNNE